MLVFSPSCKNLTASVANTVQSAIRRSDIPELFLLADAILLSLDNVTSALVVHVPQITSQLAQDLPFMATESILLKLVAAGISRQEAHEQIRLVTLEAARVVKEEGGPADLVGRIKREEFFVRTLNPPPLAPLPRRY